MANVTLAQHNYPDKGSGFFTFLDFLATMMAVNMAVPIPLIR